MYENYSKYKEVIPITNVYSAFDDDFDNDQADLIDPEQGGQQPARSITDTIKEKTLNAVKIVGDVVNK